MKKNHFYINVNRLKVKLQKNKIELKILAVITLVLSILKAAFTEYKHYYDYLITGGLLLISFLPFLQYLLAWLMNLLWPGIQRKTVIILGTEDTPIITKTEGSALAVYHQKNYDNAEIARFQFAVGKELLDAAGLLNYIVFRKSKWAGDLTKMQVINELEMLKHKTTRNANHGNKNPRSILLVKNNTGQIIGFTHILPVNKNCWDHYVEGQVSDVDFSSDYIVGENEEAYALLLFSIGYLEIKHFRSFLGRLSSNFSPDELKAASLLQRKEAKEEKDFAYILFKAAQYHINELVKFNFKIQENLLVLAQIDEDRLEKVLTAKSFFKLKGQSKDQCALMRATFKIERNN